MDSLFMSSEGRIWAVDDFIVSMDTRRENLPAPATDRLESPEMRRFRKSLSYVPSALLIYLAVGSRRRLRNPSKKIGGVMKCPVCKTETLGEIALMENLPAHQCAKCEGVFLPANAYMLWKRAQGQEHPQKPSSSPIDPSWDSTVLKLCANCGRIMARYKILPDENLYLDRCRNCNGVWLDKYEWDALVERNLHDELNEFFTRPYQERLRAEEIRNHLDKLYLEKFGAEDYARVREMRAWLTNRPHLGMFLAFLQADDPYKI
jgi:Zn-finger nucleic acid-binding protein